MPDAGSWKRDDRKLEFKVGEGSKFNINDD